MLAKNDKKSWVIPLVILIVLSYFPLFLHLDKLPIRIWDEARLAVNAIEMTRSGNTIVTFFDGQPEMWNTKPPFLIWWQAALINIFGINELSVRLPSALAALLTLMGLAIFSVKYVKDIWFGIISAIVLLTSYGYVEHHGTRTGDYDSLLTLLTTYYCLCWFAFIETNKIKYLHLFFTGVSLAVLTKTVQGLFFIPALLIYAFAIKNQFKLIFKNKWVYIDSLIFMLIILGYYMAREYYNPGYLQSVYQNELGGRFLKVIENHKHGFMFYFDNLINVRFSNWYSLLLPGLATGLTIKNTRIRNISIFCSINIVTYWLIISAAQTKLEWYDLPLFPFLALLASIFIYWIFIFLKTNKEVALNFSINLIPYLFLFFIFLTPYENMIDKVYFPEEKYFVDNRILYFMRNVSEDPSPARTYDVCWDESQKAHVLFYVYKLQDMGKKCFVVNRKNLVRGQKVIAMKQSEKEYIEKNYSYDVIETYYEIKAYLIK